MCNRFVYFNDQIVPEKDAVLSIYDSALIFGDVIFEMTRSFNKKHFKLEEHINRLLLGVKILRIPLQETLGTILSKIEKLTNLMDGNINEDDEHRLMINVSRGLLSLYTEVNAPKGPNLIISDFPLKWTVKGMGHLYDDGVNCIIPSQRSLPARLLDPKIKNRNRIPNLLANIEASTHKGVDNWALMLDEEGYISEGPGYNFFAIKDNKLYTPEGRNVLRGISRQYLIDIYGAIEKNLEPYDIYNADEAFVTATPFCMLPVVSLNGISIGTGKVGGMFNKILSSWSSSVGVDIKHQIQIWDTEGSKRGGCTPYSFSQEKQ